MPQSTARTLSSDMHDAPADHVDALRGAELVTADGRSLPLVGARLLAEAEGGLARIVLEQTFENHHEETLRVTYRMPLPADGAVSGYEFRVGDRTVTGRVEPKAQARERFEQAIVAGKTAGLLEQQRADIFTQEIGNIPSRATIVARITVDLRLAWLPEGQWELRFPTVIGPRYVGTGDTAETVAAVRIAVAEQTDARVHLELRVRDEVTRDRTVESPSHRLAAGFERGNYTLAARSGERLDRDIVVRWSVAQQSVGVALAVARPEASAAHATCAYGLLTIVPPAPEAKQDAFARDLIVLLDTSGSMDGAPLAQAQKVVAAILDSLGERDRIEVIEFSSNPRPWRDQPVPATRENKADAIRWVRALRAGGATEMHTAVMGALHSLRPHAQRQVVLVTDGYIGGEQQIVDLCHERLPAGCRLHVVGVGSAVNRSLATALSRAGRGAEVLVGLDEDVERPAQRLLARTIAPVLTDLVITGDAVVEHAPEHVPDVFTGAPLRAAVKLSPGGGELIVRGNLAHGTWERRIQIPATRPGTGAPGIVALFAREHVADLETRWTIGREAQQIDKAIEKLGVVFQISTRHTSWIAIDDEVSVDPSRGSRHETQPQELPAGTSIASFGLAGAAPASAGPSFNSLAASPVPASPQPRAAPLSPVAPAGASRSAKTVIHTGSKKPVPLDPTRGPLSPRAGSDAPGPKSDARNENAVLFSLDSLSSIAMGSGRKSGEPSAPTRTREQPPEEPGEELASLAKAALPRETRGDGADPRDEPAPHTLSFEEGFAGAERDAPQAQPRTISAPLPREVSPPSEASGGFKYMILALLLLLAVIALMLYLLN